MVFFCCFTRHPFFTPIFFFLLYLLAQFLVLGRMHVNRDVYSPSSLNQPLIYGDLIYLSLLGLLFSAVVMLVHPSRGAPVIN